MTDPVVELHALAVLDVLDIAQELVDDWRTGGLPDRVVSRLEHAIDNLEDALTRLDRLEVVTTAAA